ncbi:hypothetical protein PV779_58115, partial [Streptomyces sp. ID01-9D]|nr:hypothetical protein [Streptomyces sp. ID01-9D]
GRHGGGHGAILPRARRWLQRALRGMQRDRSGEISCSVPERSTDPLRDGRPLTFRGGATATVPG